MIDKDLPKKIFFRTCRYATGLVLGETWISPTHQAPLGLLDSEVDRFRRILHADGSV